MDFSLPGSSVHVDSLGKNTGVGCHAHFQRIFPTQGSNPSLLHYKQILYCVSHQGINCFEKEYLYLNVGISNTLSNIDLNERMESKSLHFLKD